MSEEAEVTLSVSVEGGQLVGRRRPNGRLVLSPMYRDGFSAPNFGSVRFLRDAACKVIELSVGEQRVWDLRFKKR